MKEAIRGWDYFRCTMPRVPPHLENNIEATIEGPVYIVKSWVYLRTVKKFLRKPRTESLSIFGVWTPVLNEEPLQVDGMCMFPDKNNMNFNDDSRRTVING